MAKIERPDFVRRNAERRLDKLLAQPWTPTEPAFVPQMRPSDPHGTWVSLDNIATLKNMMKGKT